MSVCLSVRVLQETYLQQSMEELRLRQEEGYDLPPSDSDAYDEEGDEDDDGNDGEEDRGQGKERAEAEPCFGEKATGHKLHFHHHGKSGGSSSPEEGKVGSGQAAESN